jgi:transposase InsO family protein
VRRRQDRRLKVLIRASFDASHQRYGSPRIHRDLLEEQHERVSRKRVIRLMQEAGVKARTPKRFVCTTDSDHALPVAANLLNREFTAEAPNQRWVGDTTEFKIGGPDAIQGVPGSELEAPPIASHCQSAIENVARPAHLRAPRYGAP